MKNDVLYQKFVHRWQEVTDLPTQRIGPLTPAYKEIAKRLKVMPWPMLVLTATLLVAGLYFLLGYGITFLVTLLQKGF